MKLPSTLYLDRTYGFCGNVGLSMSFESLDQVGDESAVLVLQCFGLDTCPAQILRQSRQRDSQQLLEKVSAGDGIMKSESHS